MLVDKIVEGNKENPTTNINLIVPFFYAFLLFEVTAAIRGT